MAKYRFKSASNPQGPLFITEEFWEAEDMRKHPDYLEIDEHGDLVLKPEDSATHRIPFSAPQPRAKLGLPKK